MTTEDQRACEVCGKPGGYRIANTHSEDPEAGELYVVRSPPWYRDAVNPKTNRPTGKRECAYHGGARCRDCANATLKKLIGKRMARKCDSCELSARCYISTDSPKCKRYNPRAEKE